MKSKNWNDLKPEIKNTLSMVKVPVILHLITLLSRKENPSREILGKKSFVLRFKGGPLFQWNLVCQKGELSLQAGRVAFPSLTLRGRAPSDLGAMLSQKKAFILPVPGFWGAGKALKSFKALASRLPLYLGGEEGKKNKALQTELLLDAALMGVVQVGNHDSYVKKRVSKMGNGKIEVQVEGHEHLTRYIEIIDKTFSLSYQPSGPISAKLIFQNDEVAHQLLTGKIRAMSALGDERIKIRGRIPLIQGLFPLLDRFSYFMSIQ